MKKILITGASGFLGGHIWSLSRAQTITLGLYHQHVHADADLEPLNLTQERAVKKCLMRFEPDVIIHTAAHSNLDACEKNPQEAFAVNVEATHHLLYHSRKIGSRFIFLSTDMVFDGERGHYRETDPVSPLSVYGRNKTAAEKLVAETAENYVIVRAALIYGRRKLGGSSFSQWIENRLRHHQTVPLYVDQFRTPILVDNLAELLLELVDHPFIGILHCAGSNRIDRFTFGQQLCKIAGYDASLLQPASMMADHPPAPRPKDVSLCTNLAAGLLRTPLLSTEEGLQRMLAARP
ncbi:SDR family oxidoreductase [candidate division KSB1 bacterium]|nr:SDR family oxidoreductase [candidate division KSB1 bacterium]